MSPENPLASLRDLHLPDTEKRIIRQRIADHQHKTLFLHKVFFATRISGYVAISAFGMFVLMSSFWPQETQRWNPLIDRSLLTIDLNKQTNIAQADTIGRLIEIQGVVQVIKEGKILPKTDISADELVVLGPGAELVVQIRESTFAKIVGPAKFTLTHLPEIKQTVLNLLEGKIIEVITKNTSPAPSATTSVASEKTAETKDTVVIKTKFVEVTPPVDSSTSFVIHQQETNAEVIATAGNVLVKQLASTTSSDDHEAVFVDAGKSAYIDNAGLVVRIPTSADEATKLALQSKDLSISYEKTTSTLLADNQPDTTSIENPSSESMIATATIANDTELVDKVIDKTTELFGSSKAVLSPEILDSLTQTLHPTIVAQHLNQMREFKYTNTDSYLISYRNLLDELNRAYTLLNIRQPGTSTDSLEAGITITKNLRDHLVTNYMTPPSLRKALETIISGLQSVRDLPTPEQELTHPAAPEEEVIPDTKDEESNENIIDNIQEVSQDK